MQYVNEWNALTEKCIQKESILLYINFRENGINLVQVWIMDYQSFSSFILSSQFAKGWTSLSSFTGVVNGAGDIKSFMHAQHKN